MFGRVAEQLLIQIDDFLGLVIQKIYLHADNAGILAPLEHCFTCFGRPQIAAVQPHPNAYVVLARVINEFTQLLRTPPPPKPFQQVVFEAQLEKSRWPSIDDSPPSK